MIAQIERFTGLFSSVTSELLNRLDRNFSRLAVEYGPYAIEEDYTFTDADTIDSLQVDASGGNRTITLPSPTGSRRRRVIKTDASANTVTIVGTINGAASVVLAAQYDRVTVEPTGTAWLRVD